MKPASLNEIKRELGTVGEEKLIELNLRLAKYKTENKELITYLLYEASDEAAFVTGVKRDITEAFQAIPNTNLYYFKKSVRKILRLVNKHAKYSGIPQTELELRLHFCRALRESGVTFEKSPVILNLFRQQVDKVDKLCSALPEDLQLDFEAALKGLEK
ncbi:MAG: hypothetical protein JNL40_15475 [Cyclobacteriaceae bacterium]|nr:hypothetical protein [Cyclobacteriaceae bacterium]